MISTSPFPCIIESFSSRQAPGGLREAQQIQLQQVRASRPSLRMQRIFRLLRRCLVLGVCVCVFPHRSHPHLGLLEQATLKQCVVGPNHAGFLLEVS